MLTSPFANVVIPDSGGTAQRRTEIGNATQVATSRGALGRVTYVLTNVRALFTGTFNGSPFVKPLTLGTLKPLPVGNHTVATYWRFRALHCDGFGAAPDNCFSAGETQLPTMAFTVTPGH